MTPTNINVLMTGGGAPGAAGILKCLSQDPGYNVTVADADPDAVGRHLHHDFEVIPRAGHPAFVNTVIALCRKKNIHILLPLVTKELLPLSNHHAEFAIAGVKLLTSAAASLEIANNKTKLYQFLEWRGIDIPAFRVVEKLEQFEIAIKELGFPADAVCFKPSVANGSRGFRIIDPAIDEHNLLFKHKPNSTYISFNDAARILASAPFPELLVSEYLPGDEYSVDCLANEGNTRLALPRIRTKMINGISVQGEFIQHEGIIQYCANIIEALKLHGNIGIQVKANKEGKFMLLEINPRVQGTISAALGAGINLPVLAIKQELGIPILPEELHVRWGTKFSRFWSEVFYW